MERLHGLAEAVALDLDVELLAGNAEDPRGFALVALGHLQRLCDGPALHLLERQRLALGLGPLKRRGGW